MALSRLKEIVNDYFTGTDATPKKPAAPARVFGPKQEMLVDTSEKSTALNRVYTHRNALTFFIPETPDGDFVLNSIQPEKCLHEFRYGYQYDGDHSSWHQTSDDFEKDHTHIIKGKHYLMTTDEVRCMVNNIKAAEKSRGQCKDGETDCLLTNADAEEIVNRFDRVHGKGKTEEPVIVPPAFQEVALAALQKHCVAGASSYAQAFITTMLEKYIKPSLINKGLQQQYAELAADTLNNMSMFLLTSSMLVMALNAIIRKVMTPLMKRAGFSENTVDIVLTELGTIAAFTQDPLSLVEAGINGTAAGLGQAAAYQLIRKLPKLRIEPAPVREDMESKAVTDQKLTPRFV